MLGNDVSYNFYLEEMRWVKNQILETQIFFFKRQNILAANTWEQAERLRAHFSSLVFTLFRSGLRELGKSAAFSFQQDDTIDMTWS